ncbi:MAG: insulinase family protein [Deltaproteobacteria bacterium]|nr:insulinase family protein [Deltaproteobacteria bacterium]
MNRRQLSSVLLVAIVTACATPKPVTVPAPPYDGTDPVTEPVPQPTQDFKPMPTVTQTATPQDLAFPNEGFRAKQPEPTAPREFKFPKMKPFTLKNGTKVYLVEQHVLPIVSMQLEFDGGSALDPKGKDGLASVCMGMLTEGTEKLDKIAYAEALADIASSVNAGASDDAVTVSLSSLTKHLDATFALFVDTFRTPGLRQSDFDRLVKRRREALKQARSSPTAIPSRVSGAMMYGLEHPFGALVTDASLDALTLDDCKAYLKTYLAPKTARLYVVGDMTEAAVRERFDGPLLASWKTPSPRIPALPAPKTMKGRIFFVHVPSAVQSQVFALQFGPKRTAPDYFQTSLLGSVFGGGFASRINMNLREDKGYSYGARGNFSYSKQYGQFVASTQVRADTTHQTILEVDREIKALWSGAAPVTKDEIDREKAGATLALPGRFATAQAALGQFRSLVYYGLPLDYYDTYAAKVTKVTEAQVKQAAQKHLDPRQLVWLVVGDGNAPMITHVTDAPKDAKVDVRNVPLVKDGKPVTLRESLVDLAARGDLGAGGFVELDVDAKIVAPDAKK